MNKFIPLDIKDSHRLINAGNLILVSSMHDNNKTITTVAWHMPVSSYPKLFAIALANKRYGLELIRNSKCFCINIPDINNIDIVQSCGTYSGRLIDKCKEFNIDISKCQTINCFSIDLCIAHIECKLFDMIQAGDHNIVIGEASYAQVVEDLIDVDGTVNIKKYQLIHHLGGSSFGVLNKI